jgi:hypothetical protein
MMEPWYRPRVFLFFLPRGRHIAGNRQQRLGNGYAMIEDDGREIRRESTDSAKKSG